MNEKQESFKQRLLAAENSLPTERYLNEMENLRERKLSPIERGVIGCVGGICVGTAVLETVLATATSTHLPLLARAGLGFGALGSLVLGALAALVARRGVMRRKIDPSRMTGVLFVFLVITATLMLDLAGQLADRRVEAVLVPMTMMMFGFAALFLLQSRAEQTELRTREKLLEIQLDLQRLSEELRKH
jgi:hypothetical protein